MSSLAPGRVRVPVVGMWVPYRSLVVPALLGVLAAALAVVALGLGDYPLTPARVVAALLSTDGGFETTIVRDWRLPRVLAALVFGAALALSGAIFQSLTRNPLGSPDIIGFTTGSYTGVLVAVTLLGGGTVMRSVAALAGGLLTALVVYLLAYRGGVQGFRLIIVGVAVTAILHSVNLFLQLRAQEEVAMAAAIWGAGSISLITWEGLLPAVVALALVAPGLLLVPQLRQLELGDDAAASHGVAVEPARLALMALGVALVAFVTMVSGPIAFVALAAPQVARRVCGGAGIPMVAAAAMGSVILLTADVVAQHVIAADLPVGVVTVVVGGLYLLFLLMREARRLS